MKKLFFLLIFSFFTLKSYSQSVEIKPNQGISVPQFTTAFIDALTNQPKGTVVFDKDLNLMKYWNGTAWISLPTGGTGVGWVENGTHIENTNMGNVGIGVASPTAKLAIAGSGENGTLAISGSQFTSHFNYPQNFFQENTYIRGGTPSSHVIINDVGSYVGVGLSSPEFPLDVAGESQFRTGVRAKGDIVRFFDNGFSGPTFYDGSLTLINNNLNTNARMKLDGSVIQTYQRNFGPNNVDAPSNMTINPFGGNVGIGTNFNPEYKLHLWSAGEQLVKIDGTNSIVAFHDRTSNAQYGFFRAWTNNPFNPANLYGLEIGTPPITGSDPAKHLMFSTNYLLRMILKNDGEIVFNGQNHKTHFFYGTNLDTYIRGGKNGSNIILSDVETGGKVGIGRYPTIYKLEVNGTMKANEVIVETGWADYVFDEKYKLKPLSEVARFIKENKHLPDIPSATEIQKNGAKLSELTTKMMQKIEELTLYVIAQNAEIEQLKSKLKN
jgi:hypothetical protein